MNEGKPGIIGYCTYNTRHSTTKRMPVCMRYATWRPSPALVKQAHRAMQAPCIHDFTYLCGWECKSSGLRNKTNYCHVVYVSAWPLNPTWHLAYIGYEY